MGIIADSFKATLDAMIKADLESQRQTQATLDRINALIKDLEQIDLED